MSGQGFQVGRESGRERSFFGAGSEVKLGGKLANHRLQDFAIGTKSALLGTLLKVSVEFQNGGIVDLFP